jgi:outer membrane protein assembly factor BamB
MHRFITLIALLAVVVVACGDDDAGSTITTLPQGSVIAEFLTPDGETYRVLLTGDAAATARQAWTAGENPGIPNGRILAGDGSVNTGHEWHVEDVEFGDMAIEVCDGTVSYIDDLGYEEFVAQHGDRFCPWSAELVGLIEG